MNTSIQREDRPPGTLQVERRKYARVRAAIPIEITPEDATAATHTQTSDISLGGCYVEMNFTLPVGTHVEMALWLGEERVWVSAKVATHHPYFGNGFAFTEVPEAVRHKLTSFLNSVRR